LQAYQAPDIGTALSANLGSAMPPHVSIGGGRFTLVDASNNEIPVPTFDPQIGVYLDCAIIDVNHVMSRIYFGGAYDPQADGVRPDCFSDNGVGPSVSASSPQASTCAVCPRAEWTKINNNGKKVPWCSQKQKVAVIVPGFPTLFLLAVPPNSHSFLREYVEMCKGNGANIVNLITRISFVPGVQGTLQFKAVSYIDEPTAQLRQAAYAEKKTDALVGRNDVARPAGMVAAPVQQAQIAPPAQYPPDGYVHQGQPVPSQQAFQQIQYPVQQNTQWPQGQVQQPGPFVSATPAPAAAQQHTMQTTPQGSPQWPNPSGMSTTQNTAVPGGIASTASPSDQPAHGRRRRRTAAEMQAAQQPAQGPNGTQAPAGAPQAPFPHPGQQVQQPGPFMQAGTAPAGGAAMSQPSSTGVALSAGNQGQQADMGFGIAEGQLAAANPELAGMLDDFFKQG
jgi:hypothetical protein